MFCHIPIRIRQCAFIYTLALLVTSCFTFPLDVPIPAVTQSAEDFGSTVKVFIKEGDLRPDGVGGFGIEVGVDGETRAWIKDVDENTEISVTAGYHEITLSHPWRSLGLFFVIPIPESGAIESQITVDCPKGGSCIVVGWPVVDNQNGLRLRAVQLYSTEPDNMPKDVLGGCH